MALGTPSTIVLATWNGSSFQINAGHSLTWAQLTGLPNTLAGYGISGTDALIPQPAAATPLVNSGSGSVGTSTLYAKQDHVHPVDTSRLAANLVGVASGVASLDSGGHVPIAQLPSAVLGDLQYQGAWNASTNSPTLASSTGTAGFFYIVSVAGTTSLNGIASWNAGDWAIFDGGVWNKIVGTNAVASVFGRLGVVTAQPGDYTVSQITGAMAASNNLSDVVSVSTARTNLGLGSAATQASSAFLQPANNLSDVTTPATALTNLGGLSTGGGSLTGALSLSGLKPGYTPVANLAYTAVATDLIIAYTSITASKAVTLPAASTGQMLIITDRSGSVTTTIVIQVTPNGADTINGSNTTQTAVNMAHGAVLLIPDKVSGWIMVQIAVEGGSPSFANLTGGTIVVSSANGFVTQNISMSSLLTNYNNKAVTASGLVPVYATSNQTALVAAQSSTSLVTAAQAIAVGLWRISYRAVITTAATSSSALGGSTGFQVNYTDSDTNSALVSASGPVSSANTVGTVVSGDVYVYGKASTAITFSFGYTTSGTTAMAYSLRVRAEWLG